MFVWLWNSIWLTKTQLLIIAGSEIFRMNLTIITNNIIWVLRSLDKVRYIIAFSIASMFSGNPMSPFASEIGHVNRAMGVKT